MRHKTIAGMVLAFLLGASASADPITRSEARRVASELIGISDTTPDTGVLAPYYIFSRGAGKGYVIVSGDDATAPILGYTEQGDYDEAQAAPQLRGMLRSWEQTIRQVQASVRPKTARRSPRARAIAAWKEDWTSIPVLLKTHWHQDYPYNMLAPQKNGQRCMTGCVATAGAQVTYYYHRDNPDELQYDTPTYGYGTPVTTSLPKGTPIRWDLMKFSGQGTAQQDSAVARLMYALGTSAWLTYGDGDGLATSGYNEKMGEAMKGQFRLNYEHKYKGGETQQEWETLIYQNLQARRPMLYSGYKDEQTGGHSVVLDGYQSKTGLFHFNFGWGGQSDGWYTVDDQTGMNGFNQYQDLVYNIIPQKQNLSGTIAKTTLWHKAPSTVEVEVANDGTLSYKGIYIYTNSQPRLPSQADAHDLTTVLPAEGSTTMTFDVTPTAKGSIYVFLCGKNKQLLDSCQLEVVNTVADLRLGGMSVEATGDVSEADGMAFQQVNGTSAVVTATLTNGPDGTYCQPSFQCYLDSYDQETKQWNRVKSIIERTTTFDAGQTRQTLFNFTDLSAGTLYKAYMNHATVATSQTQMLFETADSLVLFTCMPYADAIISPDGPTATVAETYYTLSGQRTGRPAKGLTIVRQGRKSRKMLIK